jgi:uridine kinase
VSRASVRRFADLAIAVLAMPGPVRLVGVDGCGGAGKTTFAARLCDAAGGAPVVHTDDFASFEEPTAWWPRLLAEVVEPLLRGDAVSFHPYDWVARRPADTIVTVQPAPLVVIEGVGATRAAWRDAMALRIWVDAPREVRLRRGLDRDGAHMLGFWQWWMAAEDAYVAEERPFAHADVVVDGAPDPPGPGPGEFVEVALSAPR